MTISLIIYRALFGLMRKNPYGIWGDKIIKEGAKTPFLVEGRFSASCAKSS